MQMGTMVCTKRFFVFVSYLHHVLERHERGNFLLVICAVVTGFIARTREHRHIRLVMVDSDAKGHCKWIHKKRIASTSLIDKTGTMKFHKN